jgi:phosphate acetyltransferase
MLTAVSVGSSRRMREGVYVTGGEPASGKSAVALGLQQLPARRVRRTGAFRPVVGEPQASA